MSYTNLVALGERLEWEDSFDVIYWCQTHESEGVSDQCIAYATRHTKGTCKMDEMALIPTSSIVHDEKRLSQWAEALKDAGYLVISPGPSTEPHHHHDGDYRVIFCLFHEDDCIEEYDGLVCNGYYHGPCRLYLGDRSDDE